MGKPSQTQEKKEKKKENSKKKPIAKQKKVTGRPKNNDLQEEFMKRIRGTKLQYINAESNLQIQLSFHHSSSSGGAGKRGSANIEQIQLNNEDLKNKILNEFTSIKSFQRRQFLVKLYQQKSKLWVFEEIETIQDMPEYFFDDGSDLAFILNQWIKAKRHIKSLPSQHTLSRIEKQISMYDHLIAEEILFLSLLCLNKRQQLKSSSLDFILKKESVLVNLLKFGLQKIQKKNLLIQQANGDDKSQSGEEQSENMEEQQIVSRQENQQKILTCLIDSICWAYFYISKEQIKFLRKFTGDKSKALEKKCNEQMQDQMRDQNSKIEQKV